MIREIYVIFLHGYDSGGHEGRGEGTVPLPLADTLIVSRERLIDLEIPAEDNTHGLGWDWLSAREHPVIEGHLKNMGPLVSVHEIVKALQTLSDFFIA